MEWQATQYAENARFVSDLGAPVLDLLAPRPGERILDLGCGDGALTEKIAAAGAEVLGVDSSRSMVESARGRGIDARLADIRQLSFSSEFDAVFSNAALHWVREADTAIAGVRRALRRGGRFVGEFGGHANIAAVVVALLAALRVRGIDGRRYLPWYFPTAAEYDAELTKQGFVVEQIMLVPRPTFAPTGIEGWLDTFAGPVLQAAGREEAAAVRNEVVTLLRPALCDTAGNWTVDYVRLRFSARLPD
jgi:SAM-dependent methyltransferase